MTKTQIKVLQARLRKETDIIATRRDKLREIAGDAEELAAVCDEACVSLESAIESLSTLV